MKVLLIGSNGQLGTTLLNTKPANIDLLTPNRKQFNLLNPQSCFNSILNIKPDWVINAGAYTKVDIAEIEKKECFLINSTSVESIAKGLEKTGGKLLQISTDFVFNGKQGHPYKPNQKTLPINYYGFSKAEGEKHVLNILKNKNQSIILRTSWLMSDFGSNFLLTMLKLHNEKSSFSVVADQVGCPTSTYSLSKICWDILLYDSQVYKTCLPQIMHWTDAGVATWFDLAYSIGEIGKEIGLIKNNADLIPIKSSEYETKATRPKYSVLDSSLSRDLLNLEHLNWRRTIYEIMIKLSKKAGAL